VPPSDDIQTSASPFVSTRLVIQEHVVLATDDTIRHQPLEVGACPTATDRVIQIRSTPRAYAAGVTLSLGLATGSSTDEPSDKGAVVIYRHPRLPVLWLQPRGVGQTRKPTNEDSAATIPPA
jgi:hypothetical protein